MYRVNSLPRVNISSNLVGWLNFVILCLLTGSTFLAMRIGVGPNGGFAPFWMAASRFFVAGALLLLVLACAGFRVRLSLREFLAIAASGLLLCGGGTGLASFASRSAGAGMVAIFFALGPIWTAAVEPFLGGRRPTLLSILAMLLGILGVIVLALPNQAAGHNEYSTYGALLLGPLTYALGGLVLKHTILRPVPNPTAESLSIWVAIAWQMICGSAPLWAASVATNESFPDASVAAWFAWTYLTFVSSIVGFAAYMMALRRLPTTVFMSHSWIIPVIATVLGIVVLGEALSLRLLGAGGMILLGVLILVLENGSLRTSVEKPNAGVAANAWASKFVQTLLRSLSTPHS